MISIPAGLSLVLELEVLFCAMWDDAGEDEGTLPVLPVASPSAVTSLAFSCSLAQADARIFYEQRSMHKLKHNIT